ncbi:hypothetical protein K439DRAFT_1618496 [Ramaria rubella]|nr:hypothetical protein K439DRAFT_1618496 [Ramaria rubella]
MQKPSIMVFTHKATGDIATFKLCGYIVRKELPPIYANTKPLWASQFVTICGLNLDPFTNGLKIIAALYQAFATRVGEDNIQKFSVVQFTGYPSLNLVRQYFSNIIDGTSEPIPKEIDPSGRLGKLGKNMHYNEENRVSYKKTNLYAGTSNIQPSVFQTGAFVEATFTVTAKLRKNVWKVYHDLNELVLLNDDVVKWFQAQKLDEIIKLPPPQICPPFSKRGRDEDNEEESDVTHARKKLKELDISMTNGTRGSVQEEES